MRARVRFAPSPTGELHLGGARTALVNALFARATGGRLVLRIEDTDLERNVPGAEQRLEDDLRWLGIVPDESPRESGPYPPYRQSERESSHRAAFEQARAAGRAYPCFCPPGARADRRCPGNCAELDDDARARRTAAGEAPPAWRFRLDDGDRVIDDLLRGPVDFRGAPAPDPVIVRADGRATFLFASVVDDADQHVSHVIRGDDHLPNAWKQAQMLKAIGREVPRYGHLPLILGPDREPLSKRHGHASVAALRAEGYAPEAVVLALAHLGMTPPEVTPGDDPWPALVASFALDKVSAAPAVHDQARLDFLSAAWQRALPAAELAARARGRDDRDALVWDRAGDPPWWPVLLATCAESQVTLRGAIALAAALLRFPGAPAGDPAGRAVLAAWRDAWPAAWPDAPEPVFKDLAATVTAATGAKRAALFHPLRLALTGAEEGPALARVAPLIDRAAREGGATQEIASCRDRIDRAVQE